VGKLVEEDKDWEEGGVMHTFIRVNRSRCNEFMSEILQCTSSTSSSSSGVSSNKSSSAGSCSGGGPSLSDTSASLSISTFGSLGSSLKASLSTLSFPSQPLLSRGLWSSMSSRVSDVPFASTFVGSTSLRGAASGSPMVPSETMKSKQSV
jgi:hypothetical protein